jgi:hypothetical protein
MPSTVLPGFKSELCASSFLRQRLQKIYRGPTTTRSFGANELLRRVSSVCKSASHHPYVLVRDRPSIFRRPRRREPAPQSPFGELRVSNPRESIEVTLPPLSMSFTRFRSFSSAGLMTAAWKAVGFPLLASFNKNPHSVIPLSASS